ncbi:hypothetical protein KO525_17690 [Psychrosphaera sp. B3R10]|uniref:hypothetical protein n=1 Tax=unclassified Psychrosphaera TaxID=2641570 RepID=UPI001C08DB78|nr:MULTISPECIES: hypothetical protein [unclassified Psychrosphaera]MBU2881779.1 hypothetical protein [Psychrosphaera sp. I2R16]MBU2991215.1 hypothetical protein [Psychrosphaera sp. B3R10]
MFEIQNRTKSTCIVSLIMLLSTKVYGASTEKEINVSEQVVSQMTENLRLSSDWKLQSIVSFSSKKQEAVEKSFEVADELTGKNIELNIELDSATNKLVSPFGMHVTYCYKDENTCLTWVFVQNESGDWSLDHTFENF